MTILESILSSVGTSLCSQITWNLLECSGQKLISAFKEKFTKNESFVNEDDCEQFLKDIVEKKPNSKKDPYNDVQSIYNDIVDDPKSNFIELFKTWIDENSGEFEQIPNVNVQNVSVRVGQQQNHGQGNIINAGVIINN